MIAGLDPYAGIFHTDKSGRMSLVYDFTDPFKPLVDYHLSRQLLKNTEIILEDCMLTQESKKKLLWIFNSMLHKKVKSMLNDYFSFDEALSSFSHRLAKMFRDSRVSMLFYLKWG